MATWNKHVAIGEPAMTYKGVGTAIKTAFQKDPRALAILEDMQFPEIEWFWGYAFFWGVCLVVAGVMVAWFRRRQWL